MFTGSRGNERGIPNDLMRRNNHAAIINQDILPQTSEAVQEFESHGGNLTTFSEFGHDPLSERSDLIQQREARFHHKYADFGQFFYSVVNRDNRPFRQGLLDLIEISSHLMSDL